MVDLKSQPHPRISTSNWESYIHSFDNMDKSKEILSHYGLVIVDEVHHLAALTFEQVIRCIPSKYMYGLTATPKRSDGNEKIVFKTIGNIIYKNSEVSTTLTKVLIPKITHLSLANNDIISSYSDKIDKLTKDANRNNLIINDIKDNYLQNKNILVLSDRVEHTILLKNEISKFTDKIFLINGQMKTKEKKIIMEQIKSIDYNGYIIIATGKYIGEGFDLPSLNVLFLTVPFKWEGTLSQYVGRLHRLNAGKKEVCVFDYVDVKVKMFAKMFNERLKRYKKEGYCLLNNDINAYENRLYSKNEFTKILFDDLQKAKKEVYFSIIDFNDSVLKKALSNVNKCKLIIQTTNTEVIKKLTDIIIISKEASINAIIIDKNIIWYGGLNPFDYNLNEESIMRIEDENYATDLIKELTNNK